MTAPVSTFSGFLQVAYVTTDIEQAIEFMGSHHGVLRWARLCPLEIETGKGKKAMLNIGLAYVGALQLELIQPLGGHDGVYRDALPAHGFAIRHHHVAQLIDTPENYEKQRRDVMSRNVRIALEGESPGNARYFYSDCRDSLGHYVEHIYFTPAGLASMAGLPRN